MLDNLCYVSLSKLNNNLLNGFEDMLRMKTVPQWHHEAAGVLIANNFLNLRWLEPFA